MPPLEVLVVEDNPGDLLLIQECISRSPAALNVTLSTDGETALQLLDSMRPDLILLDLRLPKLDGHEVLKRMKVYDNDPKPVVVIMSSSRNPDDIDRAFEAGASDYMPKPSDLEEFRDAVDSVLRTWVEPIIQSK